MSWCGQSGVTSRHSMLNIIKTQICFCVAFTIISLDILWFAGIAFFASTFIQIINDSVFTHNFIFLNHLSGQIMCFFRCYFPKKGMKRTSHSDQLDSEPWQGTSALKWHLLFLYIIMFHPSECGDQTGFPTFHSMWNS